MANEQTVKVFQLNDCDWWAGHDLESAIASFKEEMMTTDDCLRDPHELSSEDMERLKFFDGDDPVNADETPGGILTFRAALDRLIKRGEKFPCFFATTEI